jgi:hypothetical protein
MDVARMSAAGAAKAKENALASGARPRPEGRVRERGWRPTRKRSGAGTERTEAARRRAIARARHSADRTMECVMKGS